jgi:hypothetical protein
MKGRVIVGVLLLIVALLLVVSITNGNSILGDVLQSPGGSDSEDATKKSKGSSRGGGSSGGGSNPPTQTPTPLVYCDEPSALAEGFSPEIDGRNVVFTTITYNPNFQQSITFYDLGPDHRYSLEGDETFSDDRGVIQPFTSPPGMRDGEPHIYGNNVVFTRWDTVANAYSVMLYNFGPDGIIGINPTTGISDDIGPTSIYQALGQFVRANIDGDYVSIIESQVGAVSAHYCDTFNTGNDCMSGVIYSNIVQTTTGPFFNNINTRVTGAGNAWEYLYETNLGTNYINPSGTGLFLGNPELVDVAFPFILFFINITGTTQSIMVAGISGNPQIQIPTSSNINTGGTAYVGSIAHHSSSSGDIFATWVRIFPNGQREIIVHPLFNPTAEVIVPFSPSTKPFIDDNTLVFSQGSDVYVTECYYN